VKWQELAQKLFPDGHEIKESAHFLSGTAKVGALEIAIVGTSDHTPIGIEIALAQAKAVLDVVRKFPGRPIFILVDTEGQRLRHRDELLGINRYMAHLAKCIEFAREKKHFILALVYDQALSGGFITSGLMADACFALPSSAIRVMGLPAMARITKVPEEKLTALAQDNPVFAPGPQNYFKMGGLLGIWEDNLPQALSEALKQKSSTDERAALGEQRSGRNRAKKVIEAVIGISK
jgi:malonate decarboxylase gamma subunit